MAQVTRITSAARATNQAVGSRSFGIGNARSMIARLIVTDAPVAPTGEITLSIEEYNDETGTFTNVVTSDPISAVGTYELGIDATELTGSAVRLIVLGSGFQSYTYSATSEIFVSSGLGYQPPSLTELRAKVARDLRDANMDAFGSDEITDYINDGIAELNLIKPREAISQITGIADLDSIGMSYVWKVETIGLDDAGGSQVLPPNNDLTRFGNGWVYYAGRLILPAKYVTWLTNRFDASTLRLDVYGYSQREPLTSDEEIAEFDMMDESLVRRFAMVRGMRSLLADRALYQQWQANANNTDVSPTQLTNMAAVAEAEWSRYRARVFVPRHPPVGS